MDIGKRPHVAVVGRGIGHCHSEHAVRHKMLSRARAAGASESLVKPGRPADVIKSAVAETDASLVVMGSRRLDGLRAMGSVSRRVVHQARCSVLLVQPETLTR